MKQHYERRVPKWEFNVWEGVMELEDWGAGRYSNKYSWWRGIRTFNERKRNAAAKADGYKTRGKRRNLPTSWDDPRISRDWGRSWKDYTKHKKQYGA